MGGSSGVGEVPEADAHEQQQDAAGVPVDPEAVAGGPPTGRDLDVARSGADDADLAEQAREVPCDHDER